MSIITSILFGSFCGLLCFFAGYAINPKKSWLWTGILLVIWCTLFTLAYVFSYHIPS